jgi:hypothetical protein
MRHYKLLAAAAVALLLAACGSSGGLYPGSSTYDLRGTVDYVDTANQFVQLTGVSGYNTGMISSSGGDTVRVYYTSSTPVNWNGNTYRPQDLERGDQVSVHVDQSGNRLNAESMNVTYNARASNQYPNNNYPNNYPNTYPSNTYPSNGSPLSGTVTYVDTSSHTITLDTGYGTQVVSYFSNTPVYWNGQTYRPQDLERGDQVSITFRDTGGGNLQAQTITVTRNVSANGSSNGTYGTNTSTIRGTVDSVDTYSHLITLRSTSWIAGFNRNAGGGAGGTMVVQYDPGLQINVNGQMYSISGLQRGDIVDVTLSNPGASTPFVQSISLVRDVNQRY